MALTHLNIFLADDDTDDCLFFTESLVKLPITTKLTIADDGEKLMQILLSETIDLPHVVFLDLNMPRKNGFECLSEIKMNPKLRHLPVIMFSTSFDQQVVDRLYQNGAQYFIRKPSDYSQFKTIIQQMLLITTQGNTLQPVIENFVLSILTQKTSI
jgi:CheY-like chemotaxis protein